MLIPTLLSLIYIPRSFLKREKGVESQLFYWGLHVIHSLFYHGNILGISISYPGGIRAGERFRNDGEYISYFRIETQVSSYCPISLPSLMAKLLQRVIPRRRFCLLSSNSFFHPPCISASLTNRHDLSPSATSSAWAALGPPHPALTSERFLQALVAPSLQAFLLPAGRSHVYTRSSQGSSQSSLPFLCKPFPWVFPSCPVLRWSSCISSPEVSDNFQLYVQLHTQHLLWVPHGYVKLYQVKSEV